MGLIKWLDANIERLLAALLLASIVLLIAGNVVMRYVFNASLSWGEELTLWMFVWFVWIAVSLAFKRGEHIRITVLADAFGPSVQKAAGILVSLLILVFLGALIAECVKLMLKPFVASQKSVVLGLPIPVLYASAPVGATLSAIRVLQHLFKLLIQPAQPANGST